MAGPVAEYIQRQQNDQRELYWLEQKQGWVYEAMTPLGIDAVEVQVAPQAAGGFAVTERNLSDGENAQTRIVSEFQTVTEARAEAEKYAIARDESGELAAIKDAELQAQVKAVRLEHEPGMAQAAEILKLNEQTPQRREQLEYRLERERDHLRDNGVDPDKAWGQAAHNVLRTNLEAEQAAILFQLRHIHDIAPNDRMENLDQGYGRAKAIERDLAAEQDMGIGF